jgi:hypothetical protein
LLGVVYSIAVWGAIPWLLQLVPPRGSELFFLPPWLWTFGNPYGFEV